MATSTVLLNKTRMHPSFSTSTASSSVSCPSCGNPLHSSSEVNTEPSEAHRRIVDLEAQVKLLNTKAASAVDKLADYEDEIRFLRDAYAKSQQQGQVGGAPSLPLEGPGPALTPPTQAQQPPQQLSRLASLSSFLPGRRKEVGQGPLPVTPATATFPQNNGAFSHNTLSPPKTPFSNVSNNPPPLHSTQSDSQVLTLSSLQSSLEEERTLRLRAETSLSQTQTELEELTAQLFGQANEMVATERKARAKLEERVKVLEQRDVEKRKRLERLEKAIARIERVRGMIGP